MIRFFHQSSHGFAGRQATLSEWSAQLIDGKKANPTTCPLRPRTPWRNEQRRSGRNELPPLHSILSQLEDDGTQSITSRLWPHSLRVQMLRRKCRAWRKTAMGQTRKYSLRADVFRCWSESGHRQDTSRHVRVVPTSDIHRFIRSPDRVVSCLGRGAPQPPFSARCARASAPWFLRPGSEPPAPRSRRRPRRARTRRSVRPSAG